MNNSTYVLPAPLVNALIIAIFASLLSIAGYMVQWNSQDAAFKREVLTRLGAIEEQVQQGILPRADERMKAVERWQNNHERNHP